MADWGEIELTFPARIKMQTQKTLRPFNTICRLVLFILLCAMTAAAVAQDPPSADTVTFNKDIAPIIHEKCAGCHRPGQAGPFSLLTYEDVAKRARTIDAVIDSGYMPPWKPVDHDIKFINERRLTDPQKQKFKDWLAGGKPKGSGKPPAVPEFNDSWSLGKPDMVVEMLGEFKVPAAGKDIYRSFVFPLQLENDKWVKAIEYRPTATSSVHHAIFFADTSGNARRMNGSDGAPGIAGMSFLAAPSPSNKIDNDPQTSQSGLGQFLSNVRRLQSGLIEAPFATAFGSGLGGYVPGSTPTRLPGDLAMLLPTGSDIVMQTHFHPSGKPETEQGKLAIYFADEAPSKKMVNIQIPAMFGIGVGLKVPAGEKNYRISESFRLPTDIQLVSIGAHAHYICREAAMTATLPNGEKMVLLEIDDWDLDWQDRYYFKKQLILPAGTILTSELTYDNSADNPENPNSPPQEIRWGRESGDEMGSVSLQAIAVSESKRPELQKSIRKYMLGSIMQGDFIELLMQLDTNRDGGLQPAEAPARMQQRFDVLDRNGDGKLTPKELEILRRLLPKTRS